MKIVTFEDYVRYRYGKLVNRGFALQDATAYATPDDTDSCIWELNEIADKAKESGDELLDMIAILWPSEDDPRPGRANAALALEKVVLAYRQHCRRHNIEPDKVPL